jgi:hypothetical protein
MESAENRSRSSSQPEKTRDLSRIETIKLLNDSIDRLEQTIKNLSEDSAKLPSSDSINSLLATTQELVDTVVTPPPELATTPTPLEATNSTQVKTDTTKTPEPKELVAAPNSVQPATSTQVKTDNKPQASTKSKVAPKRQKNLVSIVLGVTAIAIAVVTIFWLWLPSQRVVTSPEPITLEPTTNIAANLEDGEPTVSIVSEPQTQDDTIKVVDDVPAAQTNDDTPIPEIIETVIPQDLESPGKAENLKVVTVKPDLVFTPEQTLVAALPNRISQAIKDYTDFVEAIEVNLPQNRLLVKITDDWYSLDEARQNKLAGKMLERSRQLDFNKLELKDSTGTLVARSPVIGDRIIILESSKKKKLPTASS